MKTSKKTNYIFDNVGFATILSTKRIIKLKIDLRTASNLCGVSSATLCRLERGNMPDMLTFIKLCTWIEVEPTFFFKAVIK